MKHEAERRKQRARERQECPVHSYQRHGKEAQELRAGAEKILALSPEPQILDDIEMFDAYRKMREALRKLLDDVDARDSLAYLERVSR